MYACRGVYASIGCGSLSQRSVGRAQLHPSPPRSIEVDIREWEQRGAYVPEEAWKGTPIYVVSNAV